MKPSEAKSPHRPIRKENEGRFVSISKVQIKQAGHTTSLLAIGPLEFRIGNALLREATGLADL